MPKDSTWLEPIRTAAAAVTANPPPLTEWEAGEDEGEVIDNDVEKMLQALGWPTRTRTFTVDVSVFGSNPHRTVPSECTERYFPALWLDPLTEHVARYVQARDADQNPDVPDQLRLRNLPQNADFDAVRAIIEGAWDHAGDELACSFAVMCPYDAMSMDGLRYNLTILLHEGFYEGVDLGLAEDESRKVEALTYEQRMNREEPDLVPGLRDLPSPKWRAWFRDTWNDRIAIHETLSQCGVEVTGRLGVDLHRASYALDADVTRMTIEELVHRVEAKHRLIASAYRAARDGIYRNETGEAGFNPCRASNRPTAYATIMETVGRLKDENVRWKEIREEVLKTYGYRSDSGDALRKQYERWQKARRPAG